MKYLIIIFTFFVICSCQKYLDAIDRLIQKNLILIAKVEQFINKNKTVEQLIEVSLLDPIIQKSDSSYEEIVNFLKNNESLCDKQEYIEDQSPGTLDKIRNSFEFKSTELKIQCRIADRIVKIAFQNACEHKEDEIVEMAEEIFKENKKYRNHALDEQKLKKNVKRLMQHCS